MHCSEFYIGITPQNLNTHSSDSNKLIAFGMFFYKDLNTFPTNCYFSMDSDPATNGLGNTPMIYQIGMPFSTNGLQVGQWKTIHGDILPYLKQAFDYAHSHGCLTNSTLADYKIATVGLNWEVMGLSRVSMQVKNLSLVAVGPKFPMSYEFNTAGDREGWTYATNSLADLNNGPTNGVWVLRANTTRDPQLTSPVFKMDSDLFKKVEVRMCNNVIGTANLDYNHADLFWKRAGEGFSGERWARVSSINTGGSTNVYVFDMTSNTNWAGEIIQLRLNPVIQGENQNISIDYIRFE
jgi:hypothetical protein